MNNFLQFVFTSDEEAKYPPLPFNPPIQYPEFNNYPVSLDPNNKVYDMVRNLFLIAEYDKENINTHRWNPFRGYIRQGQIALLKPNLVYEETGRLLGSNCITTHASILRPILDYLLLLQKQDGITFKIIIGDVPLQSADWDKIIQQTGLKALVEFYSTTYHYNIELIDLRKERVLRDNNGFIAKKYIYNGDREGYKNIHLSRSFLDEIVADYKKFSVGDYNTESTSKMHSDIGEHFYHIPKSVLKADLFINIPKIKTHQKAGITIALKNLIGINGDKSWIPHYRKGAKKFGGDEFSNEGLFWKYLNSITRRILQGRNRVLWNLLKNVNRLIIKKIFIREKSAKNNQIKSASNVNAPSFIMDGAWYGNDTLWRSILDLNYLLFRVNKHGKIRDTIQRKYIIIGDGIISGEGNGPLSPSPKKTGIVTLSTNPVIHDICCSKLMGFNWQKIPQLKHAYKLKDIFLFNNDTKKITIKGTIKEKTGNYNFGELPSFNFLPSPGWIGHMEL